MPATIVRRFRTRARPLRLISGCVGSFNDRKIGRHRRGTICLSQAHVERVGDGWYDVELIWVRWPRLLRMIDTASGQRLKFETHEIGEHRALLRRLGQKG